MRLFHYHLVTSQVREVEARYIAKLGFQLVARHGRIGEDVVSYEAGTSWEELEQLGYKHRLSELERGAVNVVIQPGQWEVPRVDHLGFAFDDDEFFSVIERAVDQELRIQEHGGRRTFITTDAGYRLEVHPPREWLEEMLEASSEFRIAELRLLADDPRAKAVALADLLNVQADGTAVDAGDAVVRFLPGGPRGRPQLQGELFL